MGLAANGQDHADLWIARQCAALVEHFQLAPQTYDLIACFRYCMEMAGLTDSGALGRFLGCSRNTAYYWITGRVRPPLSIVLHFCHLLGLDVLDLLRRYTLTIQMAQRSSLTPNDPMDLRGPLTAR